MIVCCSFTAVLIGGGGDQGQTNNQGEGSPAEEFFFLIPEPSIDYFLYSGDFKRGDEGGCHPGPFFAASILFGRRRTPLLPGE